MFTQEETGSMGSFCSVTKITVGDKMGLGVEAVPVTPESQKRQTQQCLSGDMPWEGLRRQAGWRSLYFHFHGIWAAIRQKLQFKDILGWSVRAPFPVLSRPLSSFHLVLAWNPVIPCTGTSQHIALTSDLVGTFSLGAKKDRGDSYTSDFSSQQI